MYMHDIVLLHEGLKRLFRANLDHGPRKPPRSDAALAACVEYTGSPEVYFGLLPSATSGQVVSAFSCISISVFERILHSSLLQAPWEGKCFRIL